MPTMKIQIFHDIAFLNKANDFGKSLALSHMDTLRGNNKDDGNRKEKKSKWRGRRKKT